MKQLSAMEDSMEYMKWGLATLAAFFNGVPELTYFLLMLMALDCVFGLGVAIKQRDVSPSAAWKGVTKKMGSLGIIVLAALVDHYIDILGIDLVQVTTVFYIGPEILSILRNAAILEIPVPPQFTSVLRYFQPKDGETVENKRLPENPTVPPR